MDIKTILMDLTKDTGMTTAQFSYLATFFYVAFAVFEPLHRYLMQKLLGKYHGVNTVLWGIIVAGEYIPNARARQRCLNPVSS
jgi:cyanate permease